MWFDAPIANLRNVFLRSRTHGMVAIKKRSAQLQQTHFSVAIIFTECTCFLARIKKRIDGFYIFIVTAVCAINLRKKMSYSYLLKFIIIGDTGVGTIQIFIEFR
jgi:hypothetical protein